VADEDLAWLVRLLGLLVSFWHCREDRRDAGRDHGRGMSSSDYGVDWGTLKVSFELYTQHVAYIASSCSLLIVPFPYCSSSSLMASASGDL